MKTRVVVIGLIALSLITGSAAQDAIARKRFAETEQKSIAQETTSNPVPEFKIAAEGPNSTVFVYHVPGITSDQCGRILAVGGLKGLHTIGFTQVVCTNDRDIRFVLDLRTLPQSQQPSSLSNAHPPVAAQSALPVNANPPALAQQTPSASTAKPISEYMRNVGLLYIETVELPSSIEQLQTLRALEDRIDIQTITQEDKQFYERGLKRLGHLAEIRLAELQTRLAGIQSRETQARELMSNANRELDNIQERNRAEERDYSEGLITTRAYREYLQSSMASMEQKRAEFKAASETLIEQEKLSQQNGSSTPYAGCGDSLRRMIKAAALDMDELDNSCNNAVGPPQQPPTQQQLTQRCPAGTTLTTTSYGTICRTPQQLTGKEAVEPGIGMLKDGATIRYKRTQVIGSVTRLYLSGFENLYMDIPTNEITALGSWNTQADCEKDHFVWRAGQCHAK